MDNSESNHVSGGMEYLCKLPEQYTVAHFPPEVMPKHLASDTPESRMLKSFIFATPD
jgi:hypothetical protein